MECQQGAAARDAIGVQHGVVEAVIAGGGTGHQNTLSGGIVIKPVVIPLGKYNGLAAGSDAALVCP